MNTGDMLGPYRVVGKIGAGGMGEVYRARDSKLQRDVAIKVLPELFASDPDRVMRFEREAQALAALNHPNIAQVFGVIEVPAALVMELVDGEDLATRLDRGPIPLADTLPIAVQIADALEAAHERGIVHRDLKPANIKVRDDGTVKVLDFGLAKALAPEHPGAPPDTNSPTFTSPVRRSDGRTEMGVILGTAAYMAPEQARGRAVDRRADIWSFGCVLYEMLSARQPFRGDDVSLTLANILKQPVDFAALPGETPEPVRRLLKRCLEKDPRKRLSSIGDARLELEEALTEPESRASTPTSARRSWTSTASWGLAGALAGAAMLGALGWRPPRQADVRVVRSTVALEKPLRLSGNRAFALNPAGTEIVFVGESEGDRINLYKRRLDEDTPVLLPGTEDADGPFFSQDGEWLAFVQSGRLKKMPAAGGAPVDLGPAGGMQGGAFGPDGSVVFNLHHGEGLQRIPAGSIDRTPLTTVDREKGEAGHHWPHFLPGGRHVLFTIEVDGKPYSEARIVVLSLESGERRLLIDGGTDARYLPSGHLIYWRENAIWRVAFDLDQLQVTGPAAPVLQDVMVGQPNGQAHFAVAGNGTIIYLTGRDVQEERGLMLVDRTGAARQLGDQRAFETVSISPDASRVAVTIIAANDSLWLTELDRPSFTRITFESENSRAIWSPDGSQIALARHRGGEPRQIYLMPSDGASPPERVQVTTSGEVPDSWTGRGNLLAFTRDQPNPDVWVLDMGTREARPVLTSRFAEVHPRFSPDGKWLAYVSDESGRFEVYVRPYPGPGPKRLVSNSGGTEPRWRGDGRELFYRTGDAVMAADVTIDGQFRTSIPRVLFRGAYRTAVNWPTWDALPDGKAFLLIRDFSRPRTAVNLVLNWVQ